jgi:hypothetical protein
VRDLAGNAIAGVRVAFRQGGLEVDFGVSAADGTYAVEQLPEGTYDVVVTPASLFLPQTFPGKAITANTTLDVVLVPVVTGVSGTVVDGKGNAVVGARACLQTCVGGCVDICATTGAAGEYALNVADGTYLFYVSGNGSQGSGLPSFYDVRRSGVVVATSSTTSLDVILPTRVLAGNVTDAAGDSVEGARVEVLCHSNNQDEWTYFSCPAPAESNSEGHFTLTVLAGLVPVQVTTPRGTFAFQVPVAEDTETSLQESPPVLTGTVVDGKGNAVVGARACLQRCVGSCVDICATTGAAGEYALNVADGTYLFYVSGNGSQGSGLPSFYDARRSGVVVAASSTTSLDVILPTRVIDGQVADVDGQVAVDATVSLPCYSTTQNDWFFFACPHQTQTDPTGHFDLALFGPTARGIQITPAAASGLSTFLISDVQVPGDISLAVSLQFLVETAEKVVLPGGEVSTDDEGPGETGDGASAADPIETTVKLPNIVEIPPAGALVTITETPFIDPPPDGIKFLSQQIVISAPPGTLDNPLEFTFRIHCSRLANPDCDPLHVLVFRNDNDLDLPQCGSAVPRPDPCVKDRLRPNPDLNQNDAVIRVLTSAASRWALGVRIEGTGGTGGAGDGGVGGPGGSGTGGDGTGRSGAGGRGIGGSGGSDQMGTGGRSGGTGGTDRGGTGGSIGTGGRGTGGAVGTGGRGTGGATGTGGGGAGGKGGTGGVAGRGGPSAPPRDRDGDGIRDAKDRCPNRAEDHDGVEDRDGCPERKRHRRHRHDDRDADRHHR